MIGGRNIEEIVDEIVTILRTPFPGIVSEPEDKVQEGDIDYGELPLELRGGYHALYVVMKSGLVAKCHVVHPQLPRMMIVSGTGPSDAELALGSSHFLEHRFYDLAVVTFEHWLENIFPLIALRGNGLIVICQGWRVVVRPSSADPPEIEM